MFRILSIKQLTYHWFAVKVEALFTPKSVGCSGCLLEHNPRLPTQLQSLFRYNIDDLSILRKDHVEHLFQDVGFDFLVDIINIKCLGWQDFHYVTTQFYTQN